MAATIFNDVLGPVMRGPSSSHTAGAYRIARLLRALLGREPTRVRCVFDPEGSYAPTYRILGVDQAVAAGLLEWEMTAPEYSEAPRVLQERGTSLEFDVAPLERADHPNSVFVEMETSDGNGLTAWARSIGGGLIQIHRVDGADVLLDGKSWVTLVTARPDSLLLTDPATPTLLGREKIRLADGEEVTILFSSSQPISGEVHTRVAAAGGVLNVRAAPPVFYEVSGKPLFSTAAAMIDYAETAALSLGNAALRYEARLLGRSEEELAEEMLRRYLIMQESVTSGLEDTRVRMPLTHPTASGLLRAEQSGGLALGGPSARAGIRAMACMHTCNSRGVVCAAPTGGSAGVIPGALITFAEEKGLSQRQVLPGLFAAGGIGVIFAERATFAAEIAGCQVEIGAAGAMAAAAVCELAGGSPRQCADAAAIALQNTMGSVCDPVQGGCEIPCHTRNAAAAANSFLCADLILGGYRNPIPLDETIDASYQVGRMLPSELRCTALGGIAAAPSASHLEKRPEQ